MVLRTARTCVAVLAIWLLGGATLLAQSVDIDAAKREGKVVIYGTMCRR
jgi:hypothetical protein